jgi:hypothetical protein
MSSIATIIDGVQPSVTTVVDMYTAPASSSGVRIVAFAATLITGTESYSAFIGATATDATRIIALKSITGPNEDLGGALINHVIPAGQKLFIQVSTGTSFSFRCSGIQF